MRIIFSIIIFLFHISAGYSQCPTAQFSIPDTICPNTTIPITNTTSNGNFYDWDFCSGDFSTLPTATNLGNVGGQFSFPNQFTIVKEAGKYYAFVCNINSDKLIRLDFGNNPKNTPTANNIAIIGGSLDGPGGIEVIKEGNNWYAIIVNFNNSKLTRLDFGVNIESNAITYNDLGDFGLLNTPASIKVVKDTNKLVAFITNINSPNLTQVNFGSSITNVPTGTNIGLSNASSIWGITITKECNKWIGLITNSGNGKIIHLNWGNDIASLSPIETDLGTLVSGGKTGVDIFFDKNEYHAYASIFSANKVIDINFGNSLLNPPTASDLGGFGQLASPRGLHLIKDSSLTSVFISNAFVSTLTRIDFGTTCGESQPIDTAHTPSNISYSTGGKKFISLIATNSFGNTSYAIDSIFINALTPNFGVKNTCFPGTTQFNDSSTSGTSITTWQWDFGDNMTSTAQNPTHNYADTGTYIVKLIITNSFGCVDSITKTIHISHKPTAGFTVSPLSACKSEIFNFTDTSAVEQGNITNWIWEFGNDDSSYIQSPNYAYDTAGTFTATLTAISDSGCRDTASQVVIVNTLPIPGFSVNNTCFGNTTIFNNQSTISTGNITDYFWDFDDGNNSTTTNPTNLYATKGSYNVKLIATSDSGCLDSTIIPVQIAEKANPDFSWFPPTICQGSTMQFINNSTSTDSIIAYVWDFGTGDSAFVSDPNYTFTDTGLFTVTLTTFTGIDCDTNISKQVYVNPSPVAGFFHTGICLGETTFFTDTSSVAGNAVISSWSWDFDDSNVSFVQNPTHLYADTGLYIVTLNLTTDSGCQSAITQPIQIYSLPQANFTTTLSCSGLSTNFFDLSAIVGDTINSWEWHFGNPSSGNNDTSFIQNPTHVYSNSGNYQVQLIVTSIHGCADTITQTVNVLQSPIADFNAIEACKNLPLQFSETATGSVNNWSWNFGDGNDTILPNPTHLYDTAGFYNVELIVTDLNGCTHSTIKQVKVFALPVTNFSHDSLCANTLVTFYDSSSVKNAVINNWSWEAISNKLHTSTLQNPNFVFTDTGFVQVTLLATSDEGCSDSITRTFNIHNSPTAGFSFNPKFGAPPLTVHFNNESTGDVLQEWLISQTNYSSGNPQHTFTDTGKFNLQLVVTNHSGCTDTLTKTINIRQPLLDIAVTNITTTIKNNFMQVTAQLANLGTRDIFNIVLTAEADGGQSIKESWEGSLLSGESMEYTFNAELETSSNSPPQATCVVANKPNQEIDAVEENNEFCTTDKPQIIVFNPYPNPVNEILTLKLIAPAKDELEILVHDKTGRQIAVLYAGEAQKGVNTFLVPVQQYRAGVYSVSFTYRSKVVTKKWVKE